MLQTTCKLENKKQQRYLPKETSQSVCDFSGQVPKPVDSLFRRKVDT